MRSRRIAVVVVGLMSAVACSSGGAANEIVDGVPIDSSETIPVFDSVPDTPDDEVSADQVITSESEESVPGDLVRVASVEEIAGIWMPVDVAGEPVDAAAFGAYVKIVATDERVSVDGYDGCNQVFGNPTGVRPAFDDGRFAGMEFGSEAMDCDDRIPVSPGQDGELFVSDSGDELFADGVPFTGSIRYERLVSIPVDPREAIQEAADRADAAAREAEEAAERAEIARVESEERERIRTELPDARMRWAESGIEDYTLRFENASLANDPSFPTRRPVGGVWEIEVVGGVALENEWSDSILGDTVEDWFAYVGSQLDSHHLSVEFDTELGYPLLIDSQPLDDAVVDQSELTAWLVRSEVVVSN